MILWVLGCSWSPPPMVSIPAGSFQMGASDGHHDTSPVHEVSISAFTLDRTLVTRTQFAAFVDETGHRTDAERLGYGKVSREGMPDWTWEDVRGATWRAPWGDEYTQGPNEPVVMVSWNDAVAYCAHVDKRLPTEAEWEYAMRAGASGRFPWGSEPDPDGTWRLNFWQGADHRENDRSDGFLYTSPVDHFPPNAWGVHDPVGNVWQWTADWYGAETYRRDGARDPQGPSEGWAKVGRGGSWWCSASACSGYSLSARGKTHPDAPFANNGFRCAR